MTTARQLNASTVVEVRAESGQGLEGKGEEYRDPLRRRESIRKGN
jgi:hypothetical protein